MLKWFKENFVYRNIGENESYTVNGKHPIFGIFYTDRYHVVISSIFNHIRNNVTYTNLMIHDEHILKLCNVNKVYIITFKYGIRFVVGYYTFIDGQMKPVEIKNDKRVSV